MKIYKYLLSTMILAGALASCEDKDEFENFADSATPPSNLELAYSQTNDNTGLVTLTPLGEGVTEYVIDFGDGSSEAETVAALGSATHVYSEGEFQVELTGKNVAGKTASTAVPVTVTYVDPTDLEFTAVADGSVSNGVVVTASATLSDVYSVNFGESTDQEEILVANGESVKYVYQEQGTYLITVTAKVSGAPTRSLEGEPVEVATVEFNHPDASAPIPGWPANDVINIFSDSYAMDMPGMNYNPDWGNSWANAFWWYSIGEDQLIRYSPMIWHGIDFGESIDLTGKTMVHLDVWLDGVTDLEIKLISSVESDDPKEVAYWERGLESGKWISLDIPLTEYTNAGLNITSINQIGLYGDPWFGGNAFIDNILFY